MNRCALSASTSGRDAPHKFLSTHRLRTRTTRTPRGAVMASGIPRAPLGGSELVVSRLALGTMTFGARPKKHTQNTTLVMWCLCFELYIFSFIYVISFLYVLINASFAGERNTYEEAAAQLDEAGGTLAPTRRCCAAAPSCPPAPRPPQPCYELRRTRRSGGGRESGGLCGNVPRPATRRDAGKV